MHFTTEGTTATHALTPSEVVVLHGERFTKEGGLLRANEVLLLTGAKCASTSSPRRPWPR